MQVDETVNIVNIMNIVNIVETTSRLHHHPHHLEDWQASQGEACPLPISVMAHSVA